MGSWTEHKSRLIHLVRMLTTIYCILALKQETKAFSDET